MSRINELTLMVKRLECQNAQSKEYLYELMDRFEVLLSHLEVEIEKPTKQWVIKEHGRQKKITHA